ncbi:flavin monoamine oxidase family protein [Algimonas porphyrae]|uniref:Monoamine oxidase n=1 Tax=Algimonas porphyrae TaxID=1128113 RepID=A0ABQ5UZN1_9PROT|nr:NAD(P)/FAD-dependent oxidoreductase [Algimonas porphyrae]GLQ20177.1 monoamine oxidase [Algimonas porphyrae]
MTCDLTRRHTLIGLAASSLLMPACQPSSRKLDADVIVLGAGLSGLYTAMLLEDSGFTVRVIEALPRVGGRMFTLDHGDGYTEGGGQQIGASYARVLDVAAELGVPLYAETGRGPATSHYLNDAWQLGSVDIPVFPEPFRNTPPGSVLFRLLARTPGFDRPDGWLDPAPELDISAAQFLTQNGFSQAAQGLIDRALNANDLSSYSMLNLHRTWQLYQQSAGMGATQYVEGGSQRLPEAMAASLNQPVLTDHPVTEIALEAGRGTVRTSRGSFTGAHIVCTLPFPALRRIRLSGFDTPLPLTEAIDGLAYTQIMQVHMRAKTDYWTTDDLAPSLWTDTDLERVFADSGRDGSLSGFQRGWVNGTGVAHWMHDTASAQQRYVQRLAELRPASQGQLDPLALIDWTTNNPFAGGAYYHWQPGQAARFGRDMGRPIGPLRFAGEHLGLLHTGMEAAMESAERTALDIIEGNT